jgi:hypothetical protein
MNKQRDSRAETQCERNARSGGHWQRNRGSSGAKYDQNNLLKTPSKCAGMEDESGRFVMPSVNRRVYREATVQVARVTCGLDDPFRTCAGNMEVPSPALGESKK